MTDAPRFTLLCDEVPEPPESPLWVDLLRWVVCVMDPDDRRIGFVAGCLSHACQHDGLSARQASACQAILNSVMKAWADGVLVCQNTVPTEGVKELPPIMRKH